MEKNLRQDDKSILDPVIWRINTTFWPSRGYSTDAGMVTILKKKSKILNIVHHINTEKLHLTLSRGTEYIW